MNIKLETRRILNDFLDLVYEDNRRIEQITRQLGHLQQPASHLHARIAALELQLEAEKQLRGHFEKFFNNVRMMYALSPDAGVGEVYKWVKETLKVWQVHKGGRGRGLGCVDPYWRG